VDARRRFRRWQDILGLRLEDLFLGDKFRHFEKGRNGDCEVRPGRNQAATGKNTTDFLYT
jgi:hypothetical protein